MHIFVVKMEKLLDIVKNVCPQHRLFYTLRVRPTCGRNLVSGAPLLPT